MKKVLITGAHSYVGTKVEEWLNRYGGDYEIYTLDLHTCDWKQHEFTGYDVVFHVAGIAHRKDASATLYEEINHLLPVLVAQKSREANVGQFIFMSSGAVYAQSDRKHKLIYVNKESDCTPSTLYGKSKKAAEDDIKKIFLNSSCKLAILRPPMIYGNGAKGNYSTLSNLAKKIPVFPSVSNERSMIYIDNFCEFIRLLIDSKEEGIFLPQNKEYVNTTELVRMISKCHGNNIRFLVGLDWMIRIMGKVLNPVNKVFGSFKYEKTTYFGNKYQIIEFEESIARTEK